jgi:hypothetical protein
MQIYIRKAVNAQNVSRFRVTIFREGAGIAYLSKIFRQSEGVTEGTGTSATIRFVLQIPAAEEGFISRLTVKSCDNNDQCGNASSNERFLVLPTAPTLYGPAHPSTVLANRVVTFSWQHNAVNFQLGGGQASIPADYQLTILTQAPEDTGYPWVSPDALTYPNMSVRLFSGSTCPIVPGQSNLFSRCHTLTLPTTPSSFTWTVSKCATFPEKGRRCGPSSFRTLNAPQPFVVSFNTHLAPTFRDARCVNCHAVRADGYQFDGAANPPGGLPANHPTPSPNDPTWSDARENSGQCANCHTADLLPTQGNIDPGWHTTLASKDLRNKTNTQLCDMAKDPGSLAGTVLNHLTEDKLILWAVGKGTLPGVQRVTARPNSIQTWRSIVQAWVNAGMPCN